MGSKARPIISQILTSNELKRDDIAQLASLARRSGDPRLCAQILNPIVRPKNHLSQLANEFEIKEYAASLIQLGALNEGMALLDHIRDTNEPEFELYKGIGYMSQWD